MNETQETISRTRVVVRECQQVCDDLYLAITAAEKAVKANWMEMQNSAIRSMEIYEGMKLESHPH